MKTLLAVTLALVVATIAQANPPRRPVIVTHRPVSRPVFVVRDYGYHGYYSSRDYYRPRIVIAPRPVYVAPRPHFVETGAPSHRASGLFWGALAGAIIGNNSGTLHHDAWLGAAWGAGLGYVAGSVAETNARVRAANEQATYPTSVPDAPRVENAPSMQPTTVINNYYYSNATPMSAANSMFGR